MGMYGYLAAMSTETAESLGREPDFDKLMALLSGDGALELGKQWDGITSVIDELLQHQGALLGTPVTDDLVYGPAMFRTPDEVQPMAVRLGGTSDEQLAAVVAHESERLPRASNDDVIVDELSTLTRHTIALFERAAVGGDGMLFVVL
jgi:hypothetical protein